ncbi:S8 family peptidase [Bdellovibrio bacteriovorus]
MNFKKASLALLFFFLGLGSELYASVDAVPGEYVIQFKDSVSVLDLVHQFDGGTGAIVDIIPDQNVALVRRPVFELQSSVLESLSIDPNIKTIEPNYIYHMDKTATDPMFQLMWGLKNTGQYDYQRRVGVAGMDISVDKAWDITTGSKKVIVAVIDSGIDYFHPDLKENMWTNTAELNGKSGVDDDGNGIVDDIYGANFENPDKPTGNPWDDHGHGTHCAGTIGAKANNGIGGAGVAWEVRLMAVKFLKASGSGSLFAALKGVNYATKMGAKILNNSWGGGGVSQTLKDAIEKTNQAGALFVVASGNETNDNDKNPRYPASYDVPNILTVAAVDNQGKLADFSNYGASSVHVAAPGVNILSTINNGKYGYYSGTSMAAPHVSGLAALLSAKEPDLSGRGLRRRIVATSKTLKSLHGKTKAGLVSAHSALTVR